MIENNRSAGAEVLHERISWLNILRGICSIWIVYYHLYTPYAAGFRGRLPRIDGNMISGLFNRHIELGADTVMAALGTVHDVIATMSLHAVGVFILMSGFGVTRSLLRRAEKGVLSWRVWFTERFLRLYPFLWFAHLVYLFAPFVWRMEPVDWRLVLSLTGVRAWPMDEIMFYANASWWFIWLILQLYLVLPILLWILGKTQPVVFVAGALVVSLVSRYWILLVDQSGLAGYLLIGGIFLSRLAEFAFGMALAILVHRNGPRILSALGTNTATALGLGIYILGALCYASTPSYIFVDPLCTAGLFLLASRLSMLFSRIEPVRIVLTFAGSVSLSTFLLHQPWTITIGLALHRQPPWMFAVVASISIPALVCVSWAAEQCVRLIVEFVRRQIQVPIFASGGYK